MILQHDNARPHYINLHLKLSYWSLVWKFFHTRHSLQTWRHLIVTCFGQIRTHFVEFYLMMICRIGSLISSLQRIRFSTDMELRNYLTIDCLRLVFVAKNKRIHTYKNSTHTHLYSFDIKTSHTVLNISINVK